MVDQKNYEETMQRCGDQELTKSVEAGTLHDEQTKSKKSLATGFIKLRKDTPGTI